MNKMSHSIAVLSKNNHKKNVKEIEFSFYRHMREDDSIGHYYCLPQLHLLMMYSSKGTTDPTVPTSFQCPLQLFKVCQLGQLTLFGLCSCLFSWLLFVCLAGQISVNNGFCIFSDMIVFHYKMTVLPI